MALNLSTLTNPATSGGILAEALTTADFLDPVPILKNLSRGSNKGGDAKQTTGLNQPRALPLIKNPAGNLGGYLYIPNVSGNYATGPSVTIGANQTWEGELDMVITQWGNYIMPMGGGDWALGFGILFYNNGFVNTLSKAGPVGYGATGITLGTPFNVKYGFNGTDIYADIDGVRKFTETASSQAASITHTLELNQQTLTNVGNYAIQKAKLTVNSAVVFDCDFNGSTSIRHGDTKFNCVGGPVSLTRAGQDPITVVKKGVLRFDGVNDALRGVFANNINGGYMFAAFSVLGAGGETFGRIFGANTTGGFDYHAGSAVFSYRTALDSTLRSYSGGVIKEHLGLWDDNNGDILHESKIINGSQFSKVNNADLGTATLTNALQLDEFNIGTNEDNSRNGGENAAIDLEYLALFSADSVPDEATATKIRDYINKRNNVFSLVDNSYYFFDPQKATFTGNFTGSNTLDGYITGSDLGDTDVRSNLTLEQSTLNDQPSTDGYTITFNDSAEHLEFENSASQNLSGWQICGTSLGTFAYRVQGAVTELNLLGNAGSSRAAGDSFGMLLLPESATGADIEQARKLLIDRGAADGATASSYNNGWFQRFDITEFNAVDFTGATNFGNAWKNCYGLLSFNAPALPSATDVSLAWNYCLALTDFRTTEIPNCTDFTSAWQNCSALQSFPAGAKLGTSASNVNFQSAWEGCGLTSLPALDLSKGVNFLSAFLSSDISSIDPNVLLGTAATSAIVDFANIFNDCQNLTEVPVGLDLSKGDRFQQSFRNCASLVDFAPNIFDSIGTPLNYCFNSTWQGTVSLNAVSVENILVSIDSNGQSAPSTGPQITIDYNTATGSLSAATNAAVDSLKSKGWVIVVNSVTL